MGGAPRRKPGWAHCAEQGEALSPGEGEVGPEALRSTGCHPWPATLLLRVTTAECELYPGWCRPPTFVSNSDGTVAAGEGLVQAVEPNRHVPGLRGRESKAGKTQRRAGRAREGPLSLGAWALHSMHTNRPE